MGSGDRFKFNYDTSVWGLSIFAVRFPFNLTINILFLCFSMSIGFGKAYDDPSYSINGDKP